MSEPRLAASVEASALVRRILVEGGFAAVLRRGDAERGAILLAISCRGVHYACLQRSFDFASERYQWQRVGPAVSAGSAEVRQFLDDQQRFDPDLWQIELDIAQPERFIAETTASG